MKIGTIKSFARLYHTNGQYTRTTIQDTHGDIRTSVIVRQGTNDNDRTVTIELRGVDPLAPMCSVRLTKQDIGALPNPANWSDETLELTGHGRSGVYDEDALSDPSDTDGAPITLSLERTTADQRTPPTEVSLTHPQKGVTPISTHFTSNQAADFLDLLDEVSRAASREKFIEFLNDDTASFLDASGNKHPLTLFKHLPEDL